MGRLSGIDFLIYVLIALIALGVPFVYAAYAGVHLPSLLRNGPVFAALLAAWGIIAEAENRSGRFRSRFLIPANSKPPLKNKPAQIGVLGEVADVLVHIGGVDLDGFAGAVGGRK
jgi:hypothetical protein